MMAIIERPPGGASNDQETLQRLISRLTDVFPELDRAEIERVVYGRYADFEQSKVRDFVPVLVERQARAELAKSSPHYRA